MLIAFGTPDVPLVPLATAAELAGFKGGPFTDPVVQAAGDSIRDECGWHIAPAITTTMQFRGEGTTILLPTMRLIEAPVVTDADGQRLPGVEWYRNGVLECPTGFPRYVEVMFRHGYPECPKSLLPIITERAQASAGGRIKSEALAGRSVSLEGGYDPVTPGVLSRYKLQDGP
jgi:hypothetical protein